MKSSSQSTSRTDISKRASVGKGKTRLGASETLAREALARCESLARFSEDSGSIRRTFLSPPMRECHREISRWLAELGIESHLDAAGNMRAVYPGESGAAPRLLMGSHIDTVPNAGAYDGVLGVVLSATLLKALRGRKLPFAIELIAFSEEEGVRFGVPFIGSRALAGTLNEDLLNRMDASGTSIRKAIAEFGLDPSQIPRAKLDAEGVLGYVEFHIEQGPVLENAGKALGVVEVIAGQSRLMVNFIGHANHAGTTPMHLRRDAMTAAAEWIGRVESKAVNIAGLVATIGSIRVEPNVGNVIARKATVSLDVRHADDEVRESAVAELLTDAEQVARRRKLAVDSTVLLDQSGVSMDTLLVDEIERAMIAAGCEPYRMVSGAGHDAMIVAPKVPSAMVFLRTPGGISHDPKESVLLEDVTKAIECGLHLLDQLSGSSQFLSRTTRA
jgi:allantoate deiminase